MPLVCVLKCASPVVARPWAARYAEGCTGAQICHVIIAQLRFTLGLLLAWSNSWVILFINSKLWPSRQVTPSLVANLWCSQRWVRAITVQRQSLWVVSRKSCASTWSVRKLKFRRATVETGAPGPTRILWIVWNWLICSGHVGTFSNAKGVVELRDDLIIFCWRCSLHSVYDGSKKSLWNAALLPHISLLCFIISEIHTSNQQLEFRTMFDE